VPSDRKTRHAEKLRFLLQYGMLAPARGRAQAWSFYAKPDAIELWLEHGCTLPILDPLHRELVIGCGVALAQLRMALHQLGARDAIELLPEPSCPALLARVRMEDAGTSSPEAYVLYQALAQALDARDETSRRTVSPAMLSELEAIARDQHAVLRWVEVESFTSLVDTPCRELAGGCGAEGIAEAVSVLHPFRQRSFRPSTREWIEENEFSLRSPVVCALATSGDTAEDWLAAGQALGRVLVRARVDGLHPSFRDSVAELDRLRARARTAPRAANVPQALFRLGFPETADVMRVEIPRYDALHA
jgi:hypothetical protein